MVEKNSPHLEPDIERLAAWLHDNTRELEHMVEGYQWPLYDNDDGYRGDGAYVRLIPKDITEHHRDLARRTIVYLGRHDAPQPNLAIPHGWQLVPTKMDVAMVGAWYRYKNGWHSHDEPPPGDTSDVGAYTAMLAAAPTPPADAAPAPTVTVKPTVQSIKEAAMHLARKADAEIERLEAKIEYLQTERPYILGALDGYEAAEEHFQARATTAEAEASRLSARVAELKEDTYQSRVAKAHAALFHDDPTDVAERAARFFEEAAETVQSLGMSHEDAAALLEYTFSRPVGEPAKEIGAAALTLASLCIVAGYDMMACAAADLEKLQRPESVARIRAKRATRHGRGPLPGFDAAALQQPAQAEGGAA